ncbi:MAG: P-II family nitrogen regulator [Trichococcus sp.]|uniref:P-II family nitrogen regulator n=1 Tax=Trichococcus sp. TaxID=1985464 RepID=UPI003BBA70A1
MSYQSIVTVVDKGMIDRVFESARSEESYCGTVIAGRGSGMHENKKLFNLALEPEKEILLVLTQAEHSEKIINQIEEAANITAPGNGILFGLNINRVHGIRS